MIDLTKRYSDRVIELINKYPILLQPINAETISDDDIIADVVISIPSEAMEIEDYITLRMYSRMLDIIASNPMVDGVFVLYKQDRM